MNLTPLESQLHLWVVEGKSLADCLPLARKQFPDSTVSHIEERWSYIHRCSAISPRRTADEELDWIRQRRQYFLHQLEEKMTGAENVPVSLLSLYRGVLRDHEKTCYDLIKRGELTPLPVINPSSSRPGVNAAGALVSSCLAMILFVVSTIASGSMLLCSSTLPGFFPQGEDRQTPGKSIVSQVLAEVAPVGIVVTGEESLHGRSQVEVVCQATLLQDTVAGQVTKAGTAFHPLSRQHHAELGTMHNFLWQQVVSLRHPPQYSLVHIAMNEGGRGPA